jgi:quinol monooxygenase YgiN
MIHVLATIELHPGMRQKWLDSFHMLMPKVHAEDGCLAYEPCIDADSGLPPQVMIGPDRVMVVERWRDMAALKAHAVAPHMGEHRARVKDCVKGTSLQVLQAA